MSGDGQEWGSQPQVKWADTGKLTPGEMSKRKRKEKLACIQAAKTELESDQEVALG